MQCCNTEMKDFSFFMSHDKKIPHFYCAECGKHYYRHRYYSIDEWFFYINGTVYTKTSE